MKKIRKTDAVIIQMIRLVSMVMRDQVNSVRADEKIDIEMWETVLDEMRELIKDLKKEDRHEK